MALTPLLLHWNPGRWNWIGQAASLGPGLLVVALFMDRGEVGLRRPRSAATLCWSGAGIVLAVAAAAAQNLTGTPERPDAEPFAFGATLPGPVEELAFRGIGLALLLRCFGGDRRAAVLATAAMAFWFMAGHVVRIGPHGLSLRPGASPTRSRWRRCGRWCGSVPTVSSAACWRTTPPTPSPS